MQVKNTSMVWRSYEFWKGFPHFSNVFWPRNDACSFLRNYLWTAVWKSALLLMFSFFVLGALFDLGIIAFNIHSFPLIFPDKIYNASDALVFAGIFVGLAVVVCVGFAVVISIVFLLGSLYKLLFEGTGHRISETMVGQYVSGIAHKFCPRLEFVDAEGQPLENPSDREYREYVERRQKFYNERYGDDQEIDDTEGVHP